MLVLNLIKIKKNFIIITQYLYYFYKTDLTTLNW